MKNLIMGVAKGYIWNDLEPFVVSCKKNCPNADLVLFVDNVSSFTESKLKRGGVLLQPIPEYLNSKMIIDARWEMYKNFLDAHTEYEKIFVTDTRDVILQSDLFSNYADSKNFLVYATEGDLIKNDPVYNQKWLIHLFGETEYQKIAGKLIICCGTVYGTRAEMQILFAHMIEILKRSTIWGDEQAAMNYLVHNRILPIENQIESSCNTGAICTVGLFKDYKIADEKILRGDGGVPSVVHQYDRHAETAQLADKFYREKDFQPDENFVDTNSALDQMFCMVYRQNYGAATRFFVNYILYAGDLNSYRSKLLKLYRFILKKYNPNAELLISALQKTFVKIFSANIDILQIENLCQIFIVSEKNLHFVNPSFKNFMKNLLIAVVDIAYRNGQQNLGKEYTARLANWSD